MLSLPSHLLPDTLPSDGKDGATRKFLAVNNLMIGNDKTTLATTTPTHLLLTGGSICIPFKGMPNLVKRTSKDNRDEGNTYDDFYKCLSFDYQQRKMYAITTVRTMVFKMYADIDLKVPKQVLPPEAYRTMVKVMNAQAQRFFPEGHPPIKCIVCIKDKPPTSPVASSVVSGSMSSAIGVPPSLYKHGVHFHWPEICIKREQALAMRVSMIAALERTDWTDLFGTAGVDWDEVFDESVYGKTDDAIKGLRMVGAPKATTCKHCSKNTETKMVCNQCGGRGHIIDPGHYVAFETFRGQDLDENDTRLYKNNFTKLLLATNIRCDDKEYTEVTDGWKVYPGCPVVREKDARGRKRKTPADVEGMERKFTSKPEIKDSAKEAVLRKYLVKFSPHYTHSTLRILYDEKSTYKCSLRGDGAQFCLNLKAGFHNRQNVWMEVTAKNVSRNEYVARMRCFCRCKTLEGRRGMSCEAFKSNELLLTPDDANVLFQKSTTAKHELDRAILAWQKTTRL